MFNVGYVRKWLSDLYLIHIQDGY